MCGFLPCLICISFTCPSLFSVFCQHISPFPASTVFFSLPSPVFVRLPPPAPHPLHQFSLCLSLVCCWVMSSHPAEFPWSCCCCFPFLLSSIPEPCVSLMCLHVCLVPSVAVTMNKIESIALPALPCMWVHLPCFNVIKIFLRSPWDNFQPCLWHHCFFCLKWTTS